jgi:hypothetical protein
LIFCTTSSVSSGFGPNLTPSALASTRGEPPRPRVRSSVLGSPAPRCACAGPFREPHLHALLDIRRLSREAVRSPRRSDGRSSTSFARTMKHNCEPRCEKNVRENRMQSSLKRPGSTLEAQASPLAALYPTCNAEEKCCRNGFRWPDEYGAWHSAWLLPCWGYTPN